MDSSLLYLALSLPSPFVSCCFAVSWSGLHPVDSRDLEKASLCCVLMTLEKSAAAERSAPKRARRTAFISV